MSLSLDDFFLERDLTKASTLPARWYTDPRFWQAEREKIFFKTWQWVGPTSQVQRVGDFSPTISLASRW
jgi:choline monooxygenase